MMTGLCITSLERSHFVSQTDREGFGDLTGPIGDALETIEMWPRHHDLVVRAAAGQEAYIPQIELFHSKLE